MNEKMNDIRWRVAQVALLILDVDGVLTNGRIIIDDQGTESKQFHVRDGHGLKLLMRSGIEVVFLTGRTSRVVEHRANELGVGGVYQGIKDKGRALDEIIENRGLSGEQVAYVGDDVVDIPVFRRVGFAVAVADAPDYVRQRAHYVTVMRGGEGAVREICDMILKIQGNWHTVTERYGMEETGHMPLHNED